jgi:2-oxoglutarate ferredoxin oxidoreductase subunit beta
MEEAISKRGFSFVEVISPCPTLYTRRNKLGTGLDRMKDYRKSSQVSRGVDPTDVGIELRGRIPVGKFKDIEKPTLRDRLDEHMQSALGEAYHRIDPTQVVRSDRRALRDE